MLIKNDFIYGWGGMFNARDCSAFVMDVYKSFGLMLPRNGDEQELSAGRTVPLDGLGPSESGDGSLTHFFQ